MRWHFSTPGLGRPFSKMNAATNCGLGRNLRPVSCRSRTRPPRDIDADSRIIHSQPPAVAGASAPGSEEENQIMKSQRSISVVAVAVFFLTGMPTDAQDRPQNPHHYKF